MRLLILLLIPLAFAQQPPLESLMDGNAAAALALDGQYEPGSSLNSTLILRFGDYSQQVNLSASLGIIGLSPSIDNMSCATDGMSAIFLRGAQADALVSLPSEGYPDFFCDRNYFLHMNDYAWRCDFDGDYCIEYVDGVFPSYDMNVTFRFRNVSESVPFSSTLIEVPPMILDEIKSASGAENLTIILEGNMTFIYQVDNRSYGYGDCSGNLSNISQGIPVSINRSFSVGGEKKLFFLKAPVLREQWFRNSRFDTIVLSQCPLYSAQIYEDGNISRNITLRNYTLATDAYGIGSLESLLLEPDGYMEGKNLSTPVPLEEEGNSFYFAYQFNHSYSALGKKNLSIRVWDSVLHQASFNDSLESRMLSHNGFTETGSPEALYPSRPSALLEPGSLRHVTLGLGLIGIVLILAFVNNWLLK